MENLNEALRLLVIGMVTVLVVLCLVIVIGNLIIYLTNRFMPEEKKSDAGGMSRRKKVHPKKLAAIVSVVDVVTQGQGTVDSIQKK